MLARIKLFLQSLWVKLNADIKQLWQNDKVFVIIFGVIIGIIKFRQTLVQLLVWSSKNLFDSTQKTSDKLQQEENDSNAQANKLVQDANKLQDSQPPIDDSWNLK